MPYQKMRTGICLAALLLSAVALVSCGRTTMSDEQVSSYIRAKECYIQGDYAKALDILGTSHFSASSGHQAMLLAAKSQFLLFHPEKAEPILLKLTKRYPRYTEAEIWLIRTYLAQEKFDRAEKEIESALEFNGDDPRMLQLAGSLWEVKGDYQKAFEYYSRTTDFSVELGKSEIALAGLYFRFNQADKALRHIARAKALIPDDSVLFRPLESLKARIQKGSAE